MPNPSDKELLQHSAFVRRLAHHLLGDPEAAEDVAQDALLTAIERPPRDGARWKSWLSTVTRRRAYRHLRDQDRRRRKLESVPAPDTPEPPDSIAARRAVLGRVTSAVHDLEDVYLEAVLLRYFEGLTPTEIAKRLDVPLATVSSRLQRALVKLRARLDDEADARWRTSLAVAVGLPPSLGRVCKASPPATFLWSLTMTQATSAIAMGAAVLAVLAFGGYSYFSDASAPAPQANAPGSTETAAERQPAANAVTTSIDDQPVRKPVAAQVATKPTRLRLVATVQWQDGSPARAIRAMLRGADGTTTKPIIVSEQRSVVEFPDLAPGNYGLRIIGSSHEHPLQLATGPVERRTIELTPVTEFQGRVSTVDGTPIVGAWIIGDAGDVIAVSQARGAFRVRSLDRVRTISCRAQGFAASTYQPRPDLGEEAHIVLTPGGIGLEGWVTDPAGQPAAFATVMIGKPFSGNYDVTTDGTRIAQNERVRVRTNAEGYFVAVGLLPGQVPVRVPANGNVWADWNQQFDLTGGAPQVVTIRLQRACSVAGLVRDRAGDPADGAWIEVQWGSEIDQRDQTYTDEAGRFELHDLPPGSVVLTATGRAKGQCRERVQLQAGHNTEWRPFLNLGTVGQVVDAKGQPVSGVQILAEAASFEAAVDADDNGEFSIVDCPDTLTSIYVMAGRQRVLGYWSNVDVHQNGLFLRLAPNAGLPCQITVRILGPDGQPVEDARLSLGEPGRPARIGSGRPDEKGWIRLNGPIYGVLFEAKIRSTSYGRIHLGVRAPDDKGVLDFGTVRMHKPGQLALEVKPKELHSRVDRFVIETRDGIEIVSGTGLPASGLRLAPGDYRVKLIGDELAPASVEFAIAAETVTKDAVQLRVR